MYLQSLGLLLRFQYQLHGKETVRLRHCGFSPVQDVRNQLLAIGQILFRAVNITSLFLIDEK
jgi:hypothetical protein